MFPMDGEVCICDMDATLLGKGDCYRCGPLKHKTKMIGEVTEVVQEHGADGSTRELERVDLEILDDEFYN